DQSVAKNANIGPIAFTIGDVETPAASFVNGGTVAPNITVTSDNQTVMPDGNITLSGSGANRTISLTHVDNVTGVANITISVKDTDGGITTRTFAVQIRDDAVLEFKDNFNRSPNDFLGAQWTDQVGDFRGVTD